MSTTDTRRPPGRERRRGGARNGGRPRSRRLAGWTLGVVVALLAIWLAGAWYFSDVLYEDALRVSPPEDPVADVAVLAAESGSITLAPGENQPGEVAAPGTWGLWWDGGYGRLTTIESESDGAATRAFEVIEGAPPAVGALADVDKYVFGDAPDEVLGLAWEPTPVTTPLGTQEAWLVPAGSGTAGTWAILVHGKGADRDEMLRILQTVHAEGLPALVITYRGDAGGPVDPSGVYRYGATEWADLDAAVAYALDAGAADVVLAGTSTGAALIGSWFDHGSRTGAAAGVVIDSGNADIERTFAYVASQRTVPGSDVPLPPALAWTAFRLAELRFAVDFDEVDYSDTLATIEVPMLVVHGTGDLRVPVAASQDLVAEREEAGMPVTYLETGAGEHVGSWNHDPADYQRALRAFLLAVAR